MYTNMDVDSLQIAPTAKDSRMISEKRILSMSSRIRDQYGILFKAGVCCRSCNSSNYAYYYLVHTF